MTDRPNLEDLTMEELLEEILETWTAGIRVSCVAEVTAYDHDDQRASVRPVIRYSRRDPEDWSRETYRPGTIHNCPVRFPGGDGDAFSMSWPLAEGDTVKLVIADRSIDEWLTEGGEDVTPSDLRKHDFNDAIVEPGLRSFAEALGDDRIDDDALVIGGQTIKACDNVNAALQQVALAEWVESELSDLWSALKNHTHTSTATFQPKDSSSGGQTVQTNPPPVTGSAGDVGSSVLEAQE